MQQHEFEEKYRSLCNAFGRKPNDNQAEAWFKQFERLDAGDLEKAIDSCIKDLERMPVPAQIWMRVPRHPTRYLPSCPHCLSGRIFYSRQEKDGREVESFAACDCASGDAVAEQIVSLHKHAGDDTARVQQTRYSWQWTRYGGIQTAIKGLGMQVQPVQDGKLHPRAVAMYARIKGVGVEEAERRLRGGKIVESAMAGAYGERRQAHEDKDTIPF